MKPELRLILVTSAIMCTMMDVVLSGFFSLLNVGVSSAWLTHWAKAFVIAWPVAFTTVMLVGRPARMLALRLCGMSA